MLEIDNSTSLNIFNNQATYAKRTFFVQATQGETSAYKQLSIVWTVPEVVDLDGVPEVVDLDGVVAVGPPGHIIYVKTDEEAEESPDQQVEASTETKPVP